MKKLPRIVLAIAVVYLLVAGTLLLFEPSPP